MFEVFGVEISWVDIVSIGGSIITVIGFLITIWQLWNVKKLTKAAANSARQKIKNALTIEEITSTRHNLINTCIYLRNEKFELAWVSMHDIQKTLLNISKDSSYKTIVRENFDKKLNAFNSDISLLGNKVNMPDEDIRISNIVENLEKIIENISLIINYLKNMSYE